MTTRTGRLAASLLALTLSAAPAAAKPGSGVISSDFDGQASGARYIGLGETAAAASGMPESPVWNPAGLHDLEGPVFSADFDVARQSQLTDDIILQTSPLRGRKLTYLGFASADGAFFYRPLASFNKKTVTNSLDPLNNFENVEMRVTQFGFSASEEGEKGNSLGINLSYLNGHRGYAKAQTGAPPVLELADGNGFGLDVGFQVRKEYFSWGGAFFNIPGIMYWNVYGPDQLPVLFRGGAALTPVPVFGFYTDYEKRWYRGGLDQPDLLHLGMELTMLPWLQIRGGTFGEDLSDVNKTAYTGGFSALSNHGHRVDFALKTTRVNKERVYNYFISILLPLPKSATEGGYRGGRETRARRDYSALTASAREGF